MCLVATSMMIQQREPLYEWTHQTINSDDHFSGNKYQELSQLSSIFKMNSTHTNINIWPFDKTGLMCVVRPLYRRTPHQRTEHDGNLRWWTRVRWGGRRGGRSNVWNQGTGDHLWQDLATQGWFQCVSHLRYRLKLEQALEEGWGHCLCCSFPTARLPEMPLPSLREPGQPLLLTLFPPVLALQEKHESKDLMMACFHFMIRKHNIHENDYARNC